MSPSCRSSSRVTVATLVLAILAQVVAVLLPVAPAAADSHEPPVVLVGVNGVRWDDVSATDTPALWSLLQEGAVGTLAVRSVRRQACPADGWLGVSSGRRAADSPTGRGEGACRPLREPASAQADVQAGLDTPLSAPAVPRWDVYVDEAEAGSFESEPGLLGDALTAAGTPAAAIGPGAAIALAGRGGAVAGTYAARPESPAELGALVQEMLPPSGLLVVDAGEVRDPGDLRRGDADLGRGDRAEQVELLDARVAAVLEAVPAGATVLVASLADSGLTPHLQLLAARGPGPEGTTYTETLLGSTSTRQEGLVQTVDLARTLLALLDVPAPPGLVGSLMRPLEDTSEDAGVRLRKLLDLNQAALAVQPLVPLFFNGLVLAQLLLYGAGAVALRRRWGGPQGRRRVHRWLRRVAIVFATVPVSTFLANVVPWWRADNDLLAVVAAMSVPVVVISALALLGPWRHHTLGSFGVVAGITAVVLATDVLTGSTLMLSSLMGLQPVVAGRFYGFGNPAFSLFATGALLAATAMADWLVRSGRSRVAAAGAVAVIGVLAVGIDGAPGLGSDFGGPPAMIPAFALLAMTVAGVRLTWRRGAMVAAGTLVVLASLSLVDWLRPADERTHLGRFVETALAGGAWPVVQRKAEQNLSILTGSFLTVLVPFAALFVALVLMRPAAWGASPLQHAYDRTTALRPGLVAFLVLQGIGFAVNDSGTAIPAVGATLAIPLLIAASVRALELDDPRHEPAGSAMTSPATTSSGPRTRASASGERTGSTRSTPG